MSRVPNLTNQSTITASTSDSLLSLNSSLHPENEFRSEVDWQLVSASLPHLLRYDPPDFDIGIASVFKPEPGQDPGWMLIVHGLDKKKCKWYFLGETRRLKFIGPKTFHGKCLTRLRTKKNHGVCNALHEKRRLGTISTWDLGTFEGVFARVRFRERICTLHFIKELLDRCIREKGIMEMSALELVDNLLEKSR